MSAAMRAVVSYPLGAADDEKHAALLMGLETVLAELLEEHGWTPDDLENRCADVIGDIAEEL
jgi:hypothetical protein